MVFFKRKKIIQQLILIKLAACKPHFQKYKLEPKLTMALSMQTWAKLCLDSPQSRNFIRDKPNHPSSQYGSKEWGEGANKEL